MQDNYSRTNRKIEDKGWAAMHELLDRELPMEEPKRKKRGFWIFLLFFALGLGGTLAIIGGSLYYLEKENQLEENNFAQEPIADLRPSDTENHEIEQLNTTRSTTNGASNSSQEIFPIKKEKNKNSKINQKNSFNAASASPQYSKVENEISKKETLTFTTPNASNNFSLIIDKTVSSLDQKQKQNSTLEAIRIKENYLPNKLIMKDLGLFEVQAKKPNSTVNFSELDTEREKENSEELKPKIGIEAKQGGSSNFAKISLGLVYAMPLNKEKWSYQIGANYSLQRRIFSDETSESLENIFNPIGENSSNDDNEILLQTYSTAEEERFNQFAFTIPRNLRSHYLNLNNELAYQFAPKWSATIGVTASLLLYARNDYTDGGVFSSSDLSFDADNFSSSLDQSPINRASLRDYDLAGEIGFGFHPSKKWSIQANYHHGMINLFKYSSDKRFNRYGEVAVRYYFGK